MCAALPLTSAATGSRDRRPGPTIVYITGYGRSGSTLLGNILGEVQGVIHIGELRQIWRSGFDLGDLCGCGQTLSECPVWQQVAGEVAKLDIDSLTISERSATFERALSFRRLPGLLWNRRSMVPDARWHATWREATYRALASVTGADLIVDSSKNPKDAALVSRLNGLPSYFIHLVRDPRAVAYSWQRVKDLPSPQGVSREVIRYTSSTAARAWLLANLGSEAVCASVGGERSMRLRYESFISSPRVVIDAITSLVGSGSLPPSVEQQGTVHLGVHHTVGGNPNRMRKGPIRIRPDDEWRERQSAADRLRVTALTIPLLSRYDYPVVAPKASSTT